MMQLRMRLSVAVFTKNKIFTRYFAKRLSLARPCAAAAAADFAMQTAVMHHKRKQ